MNLLLNYYSLRGIKLFAIITVFNIVMVWLVRNLLIDEIVFYNTYSEQLTMERSMMLFDELNIIDE